MRSIVQIITSVLLVFGSIGKLSASDLITYQGKLTDAASQSLPDGQYRLGVRIWDVAEGGETPLWARKYDVPVNAGVFSLMIGAEGLPWGTVGQAGGPLTASLKLALSGTSRFVEITVMSDANQPEKPVAQWQKLSPRQALGSVPYAMNGVPTGTVVPFAGATAPEGWLICDGTTTLPINDPRYRSLHNSIGNAFNIGGEPTGHFRVPDMRGRTAIGTGTGNTRAPNDPQPPTSWVRATKFGTERHKLSIGEMPSHKHGGVTGDAGAHSHDVINNRGSIVWGDGGGFSSTRIDAGESASNSTYGNVRTDGVGNHNHVISPEGGDQPHNIMQPSLVLNYIIKL